MDAKEAEVSTGEKTSKTSGGTPLAPATRHDDTQDRPRRAVPLSDRETNDQPPGEEPPTNEGGTS